MKNISYIKIGILLVLLLLLFVVFPYLGIYIRAYQGRYRECDPNELIPVVRKVFGIDFPQDMRDIKASRTPIVDRSICFILKFTSQPNDVNNLVQPNMVALGPEPCKEQCDLSELGWFRPSWARKGISQGIKYIISSLPEEISASGHIYIDTKDKKKFVIYIIGLYEATYQ